MRLECPIHGIVPREETVKGYEINKDEYVRFEPEELKALEQASSWTLVIDSFVPESAIDPVYFEGTYYLGAGKRTKRGYRGTRRSAPKDAPYCSWTFTWRGKRRPIAIRAYRNGLLLGGSTSLTRYRTRPRLSRALPIGFGVIDSEMFAVAGGDGAAFHEPVPGEWRTPRWTSLVDWPSRWEVPQASVISH
jgi:non-homologous end joining protein Ku